MGDIIEKPVWQTNFSLLAPTSANSQEAGYHLQSSSKLAENQN